MSENEKMVPKRRFREFESVYEWKQCKLGDIVDIKSGRDYKHLLKGEIPVYGTGGYMLSVNKALSYKEDAIGIGRKGTIDKPYILRAPFWTVDTLFYGIPEPNNDLNFIYGIFQNINWKRKDESTGVPSLSKTAINAVDVLVPKYEEQEQIGTFFQDIDHLIIIHQLKLEKIKTLKKAYLTEMFPAEGERKPKLRFAGFTGDWEQRKLGELGSVVMNRRIFKEQTSDDGDVPFYKIGTFGSKPDAFISRELFEEYKSKYPYPKMGDILISASGSIGRVVQYMGKDEYFQDSNIVWLQHDDRLVNSFLKQFYSVVKWSGLEGSTIKRLYNKNILDTPILLPKSGEQKKIGKFFTGLDNLITIHQCKLEKLQNIKKAYLNEMFI